MTLHDTRYTFRDKKVLLFGLGILGGGVATANWLIKRGAKVTITDLKTEAELAPSLKKIKGKPELIFGGHEKINAQDHDVIVLNPGVSVKHPLIQKAIKLRKSVINEATIFYNQFPGKIIGVTGTRGKTTTATWIKHLLGTQAVLAGNSPDHPFLHATRYMLHDSRSWAVTEMPSFQTELFDPAITPSLRRPDIAVITNIFQDHFNRYPNYRAYVKTKANLFINQTKNHDLILNFDNRWTPYFFAIPRASRVWMFSLKPLPNDVDGIFHEPGAIVFQKQGKRELMLNDKGFISRRGSHNVENLMASVLAAHCAGQTWKQIQKRIPTLPVIKFRQEVIHTSQRLTIINDTTATSPEGTIAAVKRFGSPTTILIAGGTDRKLKFTTWGTLIPNYIVPDNIILLEGSATGKILTALGEYASRVHAYSTLEACVAEALKKARRFSKATILFSPGCKSFEKFKNEYDRGEQFNKAISSLLKA